MIPKPGIDYCYSKQERWRMRKIREGKCTQCGKPREDKMKGLCNSCLEIKKEYRRKRCVVSP